MIERLLTGVIGGDKQLAADIRNAIRAFEERNKKKKERPAEVPYKDFCVDRNIEKLIPIIDRKERLQNVGFAVQLTNGKSQILVYKLPITIVCVSDKKEISTHYTVRYSRSMCQYILAENGKENDVDRHIKLCDLNKLLENKNIYAHL